jgi:hypothetical protein
MLLFLGAGTLLALTTDTRAQGPDEKGAVLVGGFGDSPRPAATLASPGPSTAYTAPSRNPADRPDFNKFFPGLQPFDGGGVRKVSSSVLEEKPDINRDIQITPNVGPWTIFLIGYTGDDSGATQKEDGGIEAPKEDGAVRARKMVTEMRNNPTYRLPAYVFYYGAEERRKENDRVKKLIAEQMETFKKNNIMPDEGVTVRHRTIEVQYAVLLGGYPDAATAKSALERMRRLPPPDAKKVSLEVRSSGIVGTKDKWYAEYVNPFVRAFVCRNPSVKDKTGPMSKEEALKELAEVRGLNSDEPYSLFNCKKPVTLAVKGFQTPFMMKGQETTTASFLGSKGTRSDGVDRARLDAHNLADTLRKLKLEAYVLHSSYSSIVTVGGYDSVEDPALKSMQTLLATKLNEGYYSQIQFFQQPVPMPVPR